MQDDTRKWLEGQLRIMRQAAKEQQAEIERFDEARQSAEQRLAELLLRATDLQALLDSSRVDVEDAVDSR